MLNLIKPKYFMPVHGEHKMLKAHQDTAMETGIPQDLSIENHRDSGECKHHWSGSIPGKWYYDSEVTQRCYKHSKQGFLLLSGIDGSNHLRNNVQRGSQCYDPRLLPRRMPQIDSLRDSTKHPDIGTRVIRGKSKSHPINNPGQRHTD